MDLYAYMLMEEYQPILDKNNILVPRLRGLRLMAEEEPTTKEQIEDLYELADYYVINRLFQYERVKKYLFNDRIIWDNLHGKLRKKVKLELKRSRKQIKLTEETFNKYCGRKDVIYIHARIGGNNWQQYRSEVENQPWFLEKVDDYFDGTYCNIYAKIEECSNDD